MKPKSLPLSFCVKGLWLRTAKAWGVLNDVVQEMFSNSAMLCSSFPGKRTCSVLCDFLCNLQARSLDVKRAWVTKIRKSLEEQLRSLQGKAVRHGGQLSVT